MEKAVYNKFKDIKMRVATGQTTTFAERNWMNIILKKQEKKRKALLRTLNA